MWNIIKYQDSYLEIYKWNLLRSSLLAIIVYDQFVSMFFRRDGLNNVLIGGLKQIVKNLRTLDIMLPQPNTNINSPHENIFSANYWLNVIRSSCYCFYYDTCTFVEDKRTTITRCKRNFGYTALRYDVTGKILPVMFSLRPRILLQSESESELIIYVIIV